MISKNLAIWHVENPIKTTISFISSKNNDENNDEARIMHSKRNNIEIIINDKADEVIEGIFKSLLNRYQNNLEKAIRGSDFVFDYVYLLYYKSHKINPNRDGSYLDSPG